MRKNLNILMKENNIDIEDDIFNYGLEILRGYFFYLLLLLTFSLIFNIVLESLFFSFLYGYLKHFTGGIHVKNTKLCIFCSLVVSLGTALFCRGDYDIGLEFYILCFFISVQIIKSFKIAVPVNKELNMREIDYYTIKSVKTIILYFFLSVSLRYFNFKVLSLEVLLSFMICTFEIIFLQFEKKHIHN